MNLKGLVLVSIICAGLVGTTAAMAAQAQTALRPTIQPNICDESGNAKRLVVFARYSSGSITFGKLIEFNQEVYPGVRIDAHGAEAKDWYFHCQFDDGFGTDLFAVTELQAPGGKIHYTFDVSDMSSQVDVNNEERGSETMSFDAKKLGYTDYKFHHIYFFAHGFDYVIKCNLPQGDIKVNGLIPTKSFTDPMDCAGADANL